MVSDIALGEPKTKSLNRPGEPNLTFNCSHQPSRSQPPLAPTVRPRASRRIVQLSKLTRQIKHLTQQAKPFVALPHPPDARGPTATVSLTSCHSGYTEEFQNSGLDMATDLPNKTMLS